MRLCLVHQLNNKVKNFFAAFERFLEAYGITEGKRGRHKGGRRNSYAALVSLDATLKLPAYR